MIEIEEFHIKDHIYIFKIVTGKKIKIILSCVDSSNKPEKKNWENNPSPSS